MARLRVRQEAAATQPEEAKVREEESVQTRFESVNFFFDALREKWEYDHYTDEDC